MLLSPAVCACFQEKVVSLSFPFSTQVISDLIIPQQCCANSWLCAVPAHESITCKPSWFLACCPCLGSFTDHRTVFLEGWSTLSFTNYLQFSTSVAQHLMGSPSLQNYLPINVQILHFQQMFPFSRKCALKMLEFISTKCSEDGWMGLRSRLNPYS